ncbi:MAG: hypothetical protein PHT53_01895, partial [Candidatus Omnitrophica bacterium]|nr:hypothetical protein [Candidatus Omnitrophota bacterium]
NGDGAINGGDLGQDAAGNPRNGTLTVANALGIGTTNPQGELHVRSTDNANGHANLILEGENPATGATAGSWDITALGSTGSNGAGANAGALQFNSTNTAGNTTTPVTVSSGAPNNSIFIAPNGNVGIGTDNPRGRLDVTARDGNGNLGGFYPPSMTTADRNSMPAAMLREGMMIYNTNTHQLEMYRPGIGWITVGGSAEVIIVSPDDRSQWSSGLACQPNSDSGGRKYYASARCPDGYKVIGGGHRYITDSDARCGCEDEQWRFVVESFPSADRSGWQLNTACFIGKPYAVCQKE